MSNPSATRRYNQITVEFNTDAKTDAHLHIEFAIPGISPGNMRIELVRDRVDMFQGNTIEVAHLDFRFEKLTVRSLGICIEFSYCGEDIHWRTTDRTLTIIGGSR